MTVSEKKLKAAIDLIEGAVADLGGEGPSALAEKKLHCALLLLNAESEEDFFIDLVFDVVNFKEIP